jgi:hypothetical protein
MSNEYEEFMNSNKNKDSSSTEEIDAVEIDTIDVEVVGVSIPFIDIFVLVFKYVIAFLFGISMYSYYRILYNSIIRY